MIFFHPNQFGYREKSNPEAAMLHTMHDIYASKNKKLLTALLTIDLSSAFDTIDHEILLVKLKKLHFPRFFLCLLESFLSDRSQSVEIDEVLSERLIIYCGSPQGGVLSGLLFNIYVNSIFELPLINMIRLFCDDISLIASGYDRDDLKFRMESDLMLINQWLHVHYLQANQSKTNYVLFSGRKRFEDFTDRALNITFNDQLVSRVESLKILGLHIDELLNFSVQTEQIKRKIIPFIAKLAKIRRFISVQTALKLYYAHIYSHLVFMNAIWCVAPDYLTESLGVIQRRALRIVHRKDRRCHNKELFSEKLLPFNYVCDFHQNLLLFKIKHGLMKSHINLPIHSDRHSHFTRQRNNFIEPPARLAIAENDFFYRATRSYNDLPENVTKFHNINSFKNRLKEYLYKKFEKE